MNAQEKYLIPPTQAVYHQKIRNINVVNPIGKMIALVLSQLSSSNGGNVSYLTKTVGTSSAKC